MPAGTLGKPPYLHCLMKSTRTPLLKWSGIALTVTLVTVCCPAAQAADWLGGTSTDWNNGTNWTGGAVPNGTGAVVPANC